MAKNIFLNQLNDKDLMDTFGVQEEDMMGEVPPIQQNRLANIPPAQPEPQTEPLPKDLQEQLFSAPKLADVVSPKPEQPEAPMLAEADTQKLSPEAPMSKSEALLAEYNKMLGKDQQSLEEARSRDRMLKIGGSIGDALATYLNAKSQMNVKAPGVQVQQGAGLGKVADMFATAPEIASDVTQRREALMKQYAELSKGERSQARLTSEERRANERMAQQERLAKAENEAMLKAAGIKASGKGELTPYQEMMREDKVKARQESDNKLLEEVENRRTLIEENINRAKNIIDKYGTVELTGSAENDLNGIMNDIATDMAKLQDPKSVARPSEVAAVRDVLLPQDRTDRLMISNKTAIDVLENFKERVNERANIGYTVRGFDPITKKPLSQQEQPEETKLHPITGKTLKKVPGGWEEVD